MIQRHARRLFLLALGLSLALHLGLAGSPTAWWRALQPAEEIPLPIEAELYTPPPPTLPSPTAARPQPAPPVSVPAPAQTEEEPQPATPPSPAPIQAAADPTPPETPVPPSPPIPAAEPAPTPEPEPEPVPLPARPVQRQLPESLTLDYAVAMGESDFTVGRNRYVWTRRGMRYSLVSTTEASGLASLFISGRIVQTSEGEIAVDGLRPAQYWLQRGKGRQGHARFDWQGRRLTLNDRGTHLPDTTQDLLGFPFHLALTTRPDEPEFDLPVTDGNKLRIYRVRYLGEEVLDGHATWRFEATRFDDGSLTVWLDPARGGLPRKIRSLDAKGKTMALTWTD